MVVAQRRCTSSRTSHFRGVPGSRLQHWCNLPATAAVRLDHPLISQVCEVGAGCNLPGFLRERVRGASKTRAQPRGSQVSACRGLASPMLPMQRAEQAQHVRQHAYALQSAVLPAQALHYMWLYTLTLVGRSSGDSGCVPIHREQPPTAGGCTSIWAASRAFCSLLPFVFHVWPARRLVTKATAAR